MQLIWIETQETNLIDLAAETPSARQKVRSRLTSIDAQRKRLTNDLANVDTELQAGSDVVNAVLGVLDRPDELYRRLTDGGRRTLNQTIFEKLYVDSGTVVDDDLREPFVELVSIRRQAAVGGSHNQIRNANGDRDGRRSYTKPQAFQVVGSSKESMVGVGRFELPASTSRTWRATKLRYTP